MKTHFVIDVDTGRMMAFTGDEEVKYTEAVSGGEGMNIGLRISRGRHAKI